MLLSSNHASSKVDQSEKDFVSFIGSKVAQFFYGASYFH